MRCEMEYATAKVKSGSTMAQPSRSTAAERSTVASRSCRALASRVAPLLTFRATYTHTRGSPIYAQRRSLHRHSRQEGLLPRPLRGSLGGILDHGRYSWEPAAHALLGGHHVSALRYGRMTRES